MEPLRSFVSNVLSGLHWGATGQPGGWVGGALTRSLCPPPSPQRSEWNQTDWWEEEEKKKRGGSVAAGGGLPEAEPEGAEREGLRGGLSSWMWATGGADAELLSLISSLAVC